MHKYHCRDLICMQLIFHTVHGIPTSLTSKDEREKWCGSSKYFLLISTKPSKLSSFVSWMLISTVKSDLALQQQRWRCETWSSFWRNTVGSMLEGGFENNPGWWSTASTDLTKQLNWGKSDPVYTDSAKKPDSAKGRLEKMLFWNAAADFLIRHHTCRNQLAIQKMLIPILLSDLCESFINSRKSGPAQLPHVLCVQGISMCGHIQTATWRAIFISMMLYLSALKCWGAEACKATEVARLVSTWSAAIQLLSSLRRRAPLCACLCVRGEALCLVQLEKLFTTDYREKDVIMIITACN